MKRWLLLLLTGLASAAFAQKPHTGPVIQEQGPVIDVPGSVFEFEPGREYKVVFDVSGGPDDPATLNRSLETVARFLNMHARTDGNGPRFRITAVLHGAASPSALSNEAHERRLGVSNPNSILLDRLHEAGVELYLCGQSAGFRGYGAEELATPVRMARSAMTVLVARQAEGYALIAF